MKTKWTKLEERILDTLYSKGYCPDDWKFGYSDPNKKRKESWIDIVYTDALSNICSKKKFKEVAQRFFRLKTWPAV